MFLQKLKQVLTKAKSAASSKPVSQIQSDNSGTDTDQGIITQLSNDVDKPASSNNRRRSYQSASDPDDDEGEKRRKFLERNR